jgi:glycosyltransferase involved in cell wall biosynthesis
VKLAVVVQRYGADIGGGSELHARYIAERLSAHTTVRVLTTCARDYVTWRNDWPEGEEVVNGIPVERFRVSRERDARVFARFSRLVFDERHSLADELRWLESQGPVSPGLIARVRHCGDEFDFVLVFTIRYHTAYYGARAAGAKTVLVPTAERDPALGLHIFAPVFRGVRAIMYNTLEERSIINAIAGNATVPNVVVGVGSLVPRAVQPERARAALGLKDPFLLYVGRIDANKGCQELFDHFLRYLDVSGRPIDLALIGTPVMTIPQHPRIRHLGYVSDEEKFDTLAAADALVMPSYYESLSMVTLEAWALGRPVLANGHCDVLAGQCLRSNAGLCYQNTQEFAAMVDRLLDDEALRSALGENGRRYYARHYRWDVIERKYLDMLHRLAAEPAGPAIEPLPGWTATRARTLPPAASVVASAPIGPVHMELPAGSLAS